jgi:hypothetical protein
MPGSRGPFSQRRNRSASCLLTIAISLAAAATSTAQAPPILNTPYRCANEITYTVSVCKPYKTDQWCQWTEQQNGQTVTTANSTWSSMTGRLQGCTVAPPAPASPANVSKPSTSSAPHTFNPPYLREFPTVDQIKAQIKGSSAQDTAYRQLTALHEFAQMITALAGPRMTQNQLTSDEVRIVTGYFNAYNDLAKSTTNPKDAYAGNSQFTASLFATFKMPTIQQAWETSVKMSAQQPGGSGPQQLPPTTDPSQLAMRRCFELGGSDLQCVGAGMSRGFKQMIGFDTTALTSSGKAGLVIVGTFKASSGLTFDFGDGSVNISNCGKMVQGNHAYSVNVSGGKYSIDIANQPQPLLLTLPAGANASGPAAQDITGQQVTGYTVTTNLKTGAEVGRTPIYGPITVHCSIGALTRGPDVLLDQGQSSGTGVLSSLGTVLGMMTGDTDSKQLSISPGARMTGVFSGSGGLKLQFNDGNAVIDCAQAHVLAPYDVSIQAGSAVVTVKNGTNPFHLTVQGDGTLRGSGTTTVNGKLMTALNGSDPVFAPTSAICSLNSLVAAK